MERPEPENERRKTEEEEGGGTGECSGESVVITDQDEFLNRIHQNFLEKVNASDFLDELRQAKALSSEDEESIVKETTRRRKARKLWDFLHRIPEEDFAESFVPQLRAVYPHVMPGLAFSVTESEGPWQRGHWCLRHRMRRRLKLARLVDLLPTHGCCTREDYRRLSGNQYCGDREWEEVFYILQTHCTNPTLCTAVETLLRDKKVISPGGVEEGQYPHVAAGGFVCTCHRVSQPSASASPEQVMTRQEETALKSFQNLAGAERSPLAEREMEESSGDYPCSTPSAKSQALDTMSELSERVDSGLYSVDSDGLDLVDQLAASQLPPFQTAQQKSDYRHLEGEINHALTRTSNLRTDYRFLEKIRDDARSLASRTQDGTAETSMATRQKLRHLLQRAGKCCRLVQEAFREVELTWPNVADLQQLLGQGVPQDWTRYIRIRHHILRNEVQECRPFAHRAAAILNEVKVICDPSTPDAGQTGEGAQRGSGEE